MILKTSPSSGDIMACDYIAADDAEIDEILSLEHVRKQAQKVLGAARTGSLSHFEFDESRMPEVADFVMGIITVRAISPQKLKNVGSLIA
jgi:hypothetical protein